MHSASSHPTGMMPAREYVATWTSTGTGSPNASSVPASLSEMSLLSPLIRPRRCKHTPREDGQNTY